MKILTTPELALKLGVTKKTLSTRKSREPWRLPPRRKMPSGELVFVDEDVDLWLAGMPLTAAASVPPATTEKRGRGRLTKAKQLAERIKQLEQLAKKNR